MSTRGSMRKRAWPTAYSSGGSVVVADGHLVDRLEWKADRPVTFDLPMHVDGDVEGADWQAADLTRRHRGSKMASTFSRPPKRRWAGIAIARALRRELHGVVQVGRRRTHGGVLLRRDLLANSPRRFLLVRARRTRGSIVSAWSWTGRVDISVSEPDDITVSVDGRTVDHELTGDTWRIRGADGDVLVLDGRRPPHPTVGDEQSTGTRDAFRVIRRVHHAITGVGDLTASGDGGRFDARRRALPGDRSNME